MRVWCICASIVLTFAAAAEQAQAGGINYDCDTAPGHFSELAIPVPAAPATISGKLKLNQIAKDPKWAPLIRLTLASPSEPGQTPAESVGFKLTALPASKVGLKSANKNAVVQFLQWDERHGEREVEHELFGMTDTMPVHDFSLSFDGQSVTAAIDGQRQRMPISASEPVARIICSTGDFLITDLTISAVK